MRDDKEKGLVEMSAVIPEINLSVNVGKNVVGDGKKRLRGKKYERANSERGHELTKHSIPFGHD